VVTFTVSHKISLRLLSQIHMVCISVTFPNWSSLKLIYIIILVLMFLR